MIDTKIVKDYNKTIDLCETFCYDDILEVFIQSEKTIDYFEEKLESENVYTVYFEDKTETNIFSVKPISFIEVLGNVMKIYVSTKVLKQVETGIIYDNAVIDVIDSVVGNKPYSRYIYEEVDKPEEN